MKGAVLFSLICFHKQNGRNDRNTGVLRTSTIAGISFGKVFGFLGVGILVPEVSLPSSQTKLPAKRCQRAPKQREKRKKNFTAR